MHDLVDLKCWLFVPAVQAKYVGRALESRADAFILDLEDSVPPGRKDEARAALPGMVAALRSDPRPVFVRVNAGAQADVAAAAGVAPDGVVLPKAEAADDVRAAVAGFEAAGGPAAASFVPAIESALGVLNVAAIAGASRRVGALMFGTGDFVADTGFAMETQALAGPAMLISLAASACGVPAFGVPGSIGELNDLEALGVCARQARSLGYAGTPVIHPKQVEVIAAAFSPSPQEVAAARRMVEAYEASEGGASAMEGRLVERPVYLRAQATLRRARAASAS